jgi:hypothetical protein
MLKRALLLSLLSLCLCGIAQAQFTSTTSVGLKKPNSGLTSGWDVYINGDMDSIDCLFGQVSTLASNSATPAVTGCTNWKATNSSTTTITNFTGGFSGQKLTLFCNDAKTTILADATIDVNGGFACSGAASGSIVFTLIGTVWTETARSTDNSQNHVCDIAVGDTSGSAIVAGQLGPQKRVCKVPAVATILEIDVSADAGTPNVIVGRSRCTTFTANVCTAETRVNLTSAALAAAASGFDGCSNAGGTTGFDGGTTCSSTLQNTAVLAGDYIELVSGTPGGTAKFMTIHVIYSVNN